MGTYGFEERLKKKIYYLENRQNILAKKKLYNQENSEIIKQYQKQYRSENLEYIRKINRANMRTKNKVELILQRYKNIANKLGLEYNLSLDIWIEIMDYFNNECCFCECENVGIGFIIPYSKNGGVIKYNVVPICKFHRKSKKNRLIGEWNQFSIVENQYPYKVQKLIEYQNKAE